MIGIGLALLIGCQPTSSKRQEAPGHEDTRPVELITIAPNSWRSATVFTHVIWNDLLFYGAGSGSDGGDPRHEMEIGVFHLVTPDSGYQNENNPVITRKQFGLNQAGKGITPLSIYDRGDSLFMFCTSRPDDDLNPHIVQISASVEDPFTWHNYRSIVDEGFSGKQNNHGASALLDPENSENLLLYFAALSRGEEYRILLAEVQVTGVSDPSKYKLVRNYQDPVLKRDGAKTNYPFVSYDANRGIYQLWYSGQTTENSPTRSCFLTESTNKYPFTAPSKSVQDPSGDPERNDNVYATGPKLHGDYLYYSGRKEGKGNYRGIFCRKIDF